MSCGTLRISLGRILDAIVSRLKKNRQNLEITSKMSNKMETDWDAEYQDIVPHFGDSYGVKRHAITDDMLELEFERVEVNFVAFGSN